MPPLVSGRRDSDRLRAGLFSFSSKSSSHSAILVSVHNKETGTDASLQNTNTEITIVLAKIKFICKQNENYFIVMVSRTYRPTEEDTMIKDPNKSFAFFILHAKQNKYKCCEKKIIVYIFKLTLKASSVHYNMSRLKRQAVLQKKCKWKNKVVYA